MFATGLPIPEAFEYFVFTNHKLFHQPVDTGFIKCKADNAKAADKNNGKPKPGNLIQQIKKQDGTKRTKDGL